MSRETHSPTWLVISATVLGLCVLAVPLSYWWANTTPFRPNSVAPNAVFLWAPYVGLPAPKRGWWLVCWQSQAVNRCRLSNKSGATEFEGDFIPYNLLERITDPKLMIDARRTEEATKFFIGDALVPLVYTQSGAILIPAAKLNDGIAAIKRDEKNR